MSAAGPPADPLAPAAVRAAYDRRARLYDRAVLVLSAGLDGAYRRAAVAALAPTLGAAVVEVGAGTGLNLGLLRARIGPAGRLVALDASRGMLDAARGRARRAGAWLVRADGARLPLRSGTADAVCSTYVVTTVPDPVSATQECLRVACAGARLVFTDDRLPAGWFLGPLALWRGLRTRGWRDALGPVRRALRAACGAVSLRLWHGGLIWLQAGTKRLPPSGKHTGAGPTAGPAPETRPSPSPTATGA